jgi:hypothetical protein
VADTETGEVLEAPVPTDPTEANNESVCSCCYQIKSKYDAVVLELSSTKEIIKLLHEERNFYANKAVSNTNQCLEYNQPTIKFDNWAQVPYSRSNRSRKLPKQYPQPTPTNINRFAPLHNLPNLNVDSIAVNNREDATEMNGEKKQKPQLSKQVNMTKLLKPSSTIGACKGTVDVLNKNKVGNKRNHKVVIIGDSHSRGMAKEVQHQLNKNFEVIGYVNPGSGAEEIVNSAMSDIVNLSKSDVVVFCGGSNDVSKNKARVALKHISNFVKSNSNTNIILLSAPHRYDLMDLSCVNNEMKSFSRKLKKHVKTSKHTVVLEINPNREFFTQHGMHLNGSGKEEVAKQIVAQFPTILGKEVEGLISLGWKGDLMRVDTTLVVENRNVTPANRENEINQVDTPDSEETFPRISNRQKKVPVTRKNYFLW